MNSTRNIQAALEEQSLLNIPTIKKNPGHHINFPRAAQFTFNLVIGILQSYTLAELATDLGCFEKKYRDLSWEGIGIGLSLGTLLALGECYSHLSQSNHFHHSEHQHENNNESNLNETDYDAPPPTKLTWQQEIWALLHYATDTYQGTAYPLLLSKALGLDRYRLLYRGGIYAGMGLASMVGNFQEYLNTRIAFKKDNERNELEPSATRKCCV